MKRKSKILLIILAVVVALALAAMMLAGPVLAAMVKTGFETAGPRLLGTETRLNRAHIRPFGGEFKIHRLHIANPEGFSDAPFLKIDVLDVGAEPTALFKNVVHVRYLRLEAPEFSFEYGKDGSNVGRIMDTLKGRTKRDTGDKPKPKKSAKKSGDEMHFRIDNIEMIDLRINVILAGKKPQSLTIGKLVLPGIGGEEGVPARRVVREILRSVTGRTEFMVDVGRGMAEQAVDKALKKLNGD